MLERVLAVVLSETSSDSAKISQAIEKIGKTLIEEDAEFTEMPSRP